MKIWLDDLRPPPDVTWYWAKTSQDALSNLMSYGSECTHISLDHDLGNLDDRDGCGHDVLAYLEEASASGGYWFRHYLRVHSANPVASARMRATIDSIHRMWAKAEGCSVEDLPERTWK